MSLLGFLHLRGRRRETRRPFSPKPARPGEPLVMGGRIFRPIGESTVEHDYRFMGLLRDLGFDDPHKLSSETPERFARRLLNDLLASGRALEALGYLLIPEGVDSERWTPDLGQETAAFLGQLSKPADKAQVRALTLSFLADFFARGLGSWDLSASSSTEPEKSPNSSPMTMPGTATGSGPR
jgi:hypothetical protein